MKKRISIFIAFCLVSLSPFQQALCDLESDLDQEPQQQLSQPYKELQWTKEMSLLRAYEGEDGSWLIYIKVAGASQPAVFWGQSFYSNYYQLAFGYPYHDVVLTHRSNTESQAQASLKPEVPGTMLTNLIFEHPSTTVRYKFRWVDEIYNSIFVGVLSSKIRLLQIEGNGFKRILHISQMRNPENTFIVMAKELDSYPLGPERAPEFFMVQQQGSPIYRNPLSVQIPLYYDAAFGDSQAGQDVAFYEPQLVKDDGARHFPFHNGLMAVVRPASLGKRFQLFAQNSAEEIATNNYARTLSALQSLMQSKGATTAYEDSFPLIGPWSVQQNKDTTCSALLLF